MPEVRLEHVSASLRLTNVRDGETTHIRTFSGVRRAPSQTGVAAFMAGVNLLREVRATNAVLTTRAEIAPLP